MNQPSLSNPNADHRRARQLGHIRLAVVGLVAVAIAAALPGFAPYGVLADWAVGNTRIVCLAIAAAAMLYAVLLSFTAWLFSARLRVAPRPEPSPLQGQPSTIRPARGRRLSFARLAPMLIFLVAMLLVGRWYAYVTASPEPSGSLGETLNAFMPGPLREWGCDQLRLRFASKPPPKGCGRDRDLGQWP